MLDVAVIIVSWNVRDYLSQALSSVYAELRRTRLRGEVWVVDNGSTDGTLALLANLFPQTHVIANQQNVGFGAANNQGMAAAAGKEPRYYLLLNPDTLVRPLSLKELVSFLDAHPEAGAAGPRLVHQDGRFQPSAFSFPGIMQVVCDLWPVPGRLYESRLNGRYPRGHFHPESEPFDVDFVLGAAMVVRRDVAEKTGGFDESYHMYCEEIDWAWRIREAGWSIYIVPAAEIVHYGGSSTKQVKARSIVDLWTSRARLYRSHQDRLTFAVARRFAHHGLLNKAAKVEDPALRAAYETVARQWNGEEPLAPAPGEVVAG